FVRRHSAAPCTDCHKPFRVQAGTRKPGSADKCPRLARGREKRKNPRRLGFIWGIRIRIMSISHTDVGDNLRTIVILGRLDIPGTESVAGELEKLAAAPKKGVVVDLSSLKFLASIGIRALFNSAKVVQARGGRMVLVVGTNSSVVMSLEATGVNDLIPIFR